MRRERFNWIFTGLIVGIALAFTGLTLTGCGDDKAAGSVAGEAQKTVDMRVGELKKAGGAMQFLSKYDGADKAKAEAAIAALENVSQNIVSWFPEGTGPGAEGVVKTRARPEIWSDRTGFEARAIAFAAAVESLKGAVAANDPASVATLAGAVGGACKACHQAYRGPET